MKIKKAIKKVCAWLTRILIAVHVNRKHSADMDEAKKIVHDVYEPDPNVMKRDGRDTSDNQYDLSLIIPVYNGEKYLHECIDSLVMQNTKYNYELIFVNDGSSDQSLNILQEYNADNIKIITQKNQGISAARNTGLFEAHGKFIGFIDNDDYVSADYVDMMLSQAFENNADIVKCGCVEFETDSGEILYDWTNKESASINGYMGLRILKYDGYVWGCVFKRTLWNKFCFPRGFWYEDMITRFLPMRLCSNFVYINKALYYKRVHQNNAAKTIWSNKSLKCLEQYYLAEYLIVLNEYLELPKDETLYRLTVEEMSFMLGLRTYGLKRKIRKAVFFMGCALCESVNNNYGFQTQYEKALKNYDYQLWALLTLRDKLEY